MRNRRNTRRKNVILETITNKNFIRISSILLVAIIILFGSIKIRNYFDKKELAEQARELDKQTGEIFTAMETEIKETNTKKDGIKKTSTAKISAVGDILCQMDMIQDAQNEDSYDFSYMFDNITKYVKKSDIAIGTLETNFTSNRYSGVGKYNTPTEFLTAVKNSGISLVSLAHNHVLDYGEDGLNQTISKIHEKGMSITGIQNNEENENSEFTGNIKEVNGIKIAFLSYTYGLSNENEISEEEKSKVNIFSEELALKDIQYAKENSNYIIVIMHWGDVNSSTITDYQNNITGFLVNNDVDMILGSHPSVVEPMKIIQNAEGKNILVAYSLGNYISSLKYENADVELILNIQIAKSEDQEKAVLQKVDYTPIYVLDNGTKSEKRFELTDMKQLAKDYANGDTSKISRKKYDEIIKKLDELQKIVNEN
jgi:poly-gamma-glutamate capsule biosynthesis protein CapA/YwtB (metallophosphatase superfamily)